jgi:hypothetical protein
MINNYRKGQKVQQKAKRYYESLGYEVEVVRYNKFSKSKDFFGLWDLICVGEHNVRFVQVKANKKPAKEWQERAREWGTRGSKIIREWVVYKDYQRGDAPSAIVTLSPR